MKNQIKYGDYVKLNHKLARKALARLKAAGIAADYDDVFQEFAVSWVKALNAFDPSRGFTFSTYYVNAAWTNFIRYYGKSAIGAHDVRMDAPLNEDVNLHETLADTNSISVEEKLQRQQHRAGVLKKISPAARKVIEILENPPGILKKEFCAIQSKATYARKKGMSVRIPENMSAAFVMNALGMPPQARRKVYEEFRAITNLK